MTQEFNTENNPIRVYRDQNTGLITMVLNDVTIDFDDDCVLLVVEKLIHAINE